MKKILTLLLFFISLSLSAQFQFYNTYFTSKLILSTLHNHNNEFYIVCGNQSGVNSTTTDRVILKLDTSGNLLKKQIYTGFGYNNYLFDKDVYIWKDSSFYNFYSSSDSTFQLMAFNYNLDTLWTETIIAQDTSLTAFFDLFDMVSLANNDLLLMFNAYKKASNYTYYSYTVFTKVKDHKSYMTSKQTNHKFSFSLKNSNTIVTSDSNLLVYGNNQLRKYNFNGILLDSLVVPLIVTNYIYNIKYIGDNKYVLVGKGNSDIGDPYEFKINMAMIDYAKWELVWHKTYPIEQSVLENTDIYINSIDDSNIVFTSNLEYGRSPANYDSKFSGFHLILNKLGDSLSFFRVLNDNNYHYTINDINFINDNTVLGIGCVYNDPDHLYGYYHKLQLIYKRRFKIPPLPSEKPEKKEFKWSIYPNPSFEEVQLEVDKDFVGIIADINIYNYNGEQIAHYPSFVLKNGSLFKVNQLTSGVYFFVITIGKERYIKRLNVL